MAQARAIKPTVRQRLSRRAQHGDGIFYLITLFFALIVIGLVIAIAVVVYNGSALARHVGCNRVHARALSRIGQANRFSWDAPPFWQVESKLALTEVRHENVLGRRVLARHARQLVQRPTRGQQWPKGVGQPPTRHPAVPTTNLSSGTQPAANWKCCC